LLIILCFGCGLCSLSLLWSNRTKPSMSSSETSGRPGSSITSELYGPNVGEEAKSVGGRTDDTEGEEARCEEGVDVTMDDHDLDDPFTTTPLSPATYKLDMGDGGSVVILSCKYSISSSMASSISQPSRKGRRLILLASLSFSSILLSIRVNSLWFESSPISLEASRKRWTTAHWISRDRNQHQRGSLSPTFISLSLPGYTHTR
jgi:hypothetical protein